MVSLGSGSFGRKLSNSVGQKVGVRWVWEVWVGVGVPVAVGGLGKWESVRGSSPSSPSSGKSSSVCLALGPDNQLPLKCANAPQYKRKARGCACREVRTNAKNSIGS